MAYCVKCGARVEDDVRFCPYCGAEIPGAGKVSDTADHAYTAGSNTKEPQDDIYSQDEYFDASEVKRNKGMGVLSYLGILFLIPLLAGDKRSAYVKHHVNQGIVLFLLSFIVDLLDGRWIWRIHTWMGPGSSVFSGLVDIADFVCLILFVMGIVSACKGTRRELPMIGKIKIIK